MSLCGGPEVRIQVEAVHATHSFTRKFCGCMSLRPGCALACALWIGINLYCAILAFQYSSPIFSYLNEYALVTFGAICLLFAIAAIFGLVALFVESAMLLQTGHRIIWIVVILFLADYFGTIIVFSMEEDSFTDWCIHTAGTTDRNRIVRANGTVTAIPFIVDTEVFNCHKLWQDELKLGIALYIVILICYLYWATCLWSFAQKILAVQGDVSAITASGPFHRQQGIVLHPPPPRAPMTNLMGNLKPTNIMFFNDGTITTQSLGQSIQRPPPIFENEYDEDSQKSAAQHARIVWKKLVSKLSA